MKAVRALEERLKAWRSFRDVAHATRSLAAARVLRWNAQVGHTRRQLAWSQAIHERVQLYDGDLIDIGPWTIVIRSRQLPRRRKMPTPAELSMEFTPSDQAIVAKVKVPQHLIHDDTSSSIIII